MTLSDLSLATGAGCEHSRRDRVARGVGVALGKCIRQAVETGRLKCGILASAQLLQRCPERVLLCILPVSQKNVCDHALHIHHTLITAFCVEHGIRCLRVQDEDLTRAVTCFTDKHLDNWDSDSVHHTTNTGVTTCPPHCATTKPDVSCVLIKSPKDRSLSFEDEVVLDYHDDVMDSVVFPKPVLSIPG